MNLREKILFPIIAGAVGNVLATMMIWVPSHISVTFERTASLGHTTSTYGTGRADSTYGTGVADNTYGGPGGIEYTYGGLSYVKNLGHRPTGR